MMSEAMLWAVGAIFAFIVVAIIVNNDEPL